MAALYAMMLGAPQAPDGYKYAYTCWWSVNRLHYIPDEHLFRLILSDQGEVVDMGMGPKLIQVFELPGRVHVYVPDRQPGAELASQQDQPSEPFQGQDPSS